MTETTNAPGAAKPPIEDEVQEDQDQASVDHGPETLGSSAMCHTCDQHPPKYTCPGCGRKTCSLACVKEHKVRFSCTGKRDRTAFVKRTDLSYDTLKSDYKFLEEINRIEDVSKRTQPPAARRQLPKPLKNLVEQARSRGVSLVLVSPGMTRRRQNTTRFDFKSKLIHWRVEWVFDDGRVETTARMSEEASIGQALEDVVRRITGDTDVTKDTTPTTTTTTTPRTTKVRMRQEGVRADEAVDFDVDLSLTLGEFLRGKHIVEFPTFRIHGETT
jgi:hypothetical protein